MKHRTILYYMNWKYSKKLLSSKKFQIILDIKPSKKIQALFHQHFFSWPLHDP